MSDLPAYPREAAEREETTAAPTAGLELASWLSRLGAYLIDSLLLFVPLAVIIAVLFALNPDDDSGAWGILAVAYLATLVLPFVYFTVMHGGGRGQTYGKRALGIRVVDDHGGPIGHGRAFGRYAITIAFGLFIVPALVDYLWPLGDKRNQSLHDKAVGSLVVRA